MWEGGFLPPPPLKKNIFFTFFKILNKKNGFWIKLPLHVPLEASRGVAASLDILYLLSIPPSFIYITFTKHQEGRGHWTGNYTGTQRFATTLCYLLTQKVWVFVLVSSKLVLSKIFNHQFKV